MPKQITVPLTQIREYIPEVLEAMGNPTAWDVLFVGDGSGSRVGYPGGWAVYVIDKESQLVHLMYGAVSDTTVNICELLPYIHAIWWYHKTRGRTVLMENARRGVLTPLRVHILTDCAIIAKQGNGEAGRFENAIFWASLDTAARNGYTFKFHFQERDSNETNRLCDELSKRLRKLIQSIEETAEAEIGASVDVTT